MNMRRHKHFVQAKVWIGICDAYWQRRIDLALTETPEEAAARQAQQAVWFDELWADITKKQAVRQLVEPDPVEAAKVEYVVAKKSTGEVVATFDVEEDALAMIEKAKKAKKASLILV